MSFKPGATNPSMTDTGNNAGLVIGISVTVVLVLMIVSVLVYCLWKRKRDNADYAQPNVKLSDIPNSEDGREQNRDKHPPVPDVEVIYEEPAVYAQLDSSKRVSTDESYQSLNTHYTKLDRNLKEEVQEYTPLNMIGNSETNFPQQLE